jgi:hypothetical protein
VICDLLSELFNEFKVAGDVGIELTLKLSEGFMSRCLLLNELFKQ